MKALHRTLNCTGSKIEVPTKQLSLSEWLGNQFHLYVIPVRTAPDDIHTRDLGALGNSLRAQYQTFLSLISSYGQRLATIIHSIGASAPRFLRGKGWRHHTC